MDATDFGIPYPTYLHLAKDVDVFIWQDRMRKLERKWLFSFVGALSPANAKSIREQFVNQCKNSSGCKLLECYFGERKCHSPSRICRSYWAPFFCLQPQAELYTRRSAFKSCPHVSWLLICLLQHNRLSLFQRIIQSIRCSFQRIASVRGILALSKGFFKFLLSW